MQEASPTTAATTKALSNTTYVYSMQYTMHTVIIVPLLSVGVCSIYWCDSRQSFFLGSHLFLFICSWYVGS
jgi:hypothetical protein